MQYAVVLHQAEKGGFWAEVPSLPGCFAQGETVGDTLADMQEAIQSHLEALKNDGQIIPIDDVLPEITQVEVSV
jgi:predicted RNase H-like HicB family nuclease